MIHAWLIDGSVYCWLIDRLVVWRIQLAIDQLLVVSRWLISWAFTCYVSNTWAIIDWLIDWLMWWSLIWLMVDWLVGRATHSCWSVDMSTDGWLVDRSIGQLLISVDWSVWLMYQLIDATTIWNIQINDTLISWFDWLIDRQFESEKWWVDWLMGWLDVMNV